MLSVGEILKKQRLEKGLTLQLVEKQIRVREKYLKAIENNDWSFFSSKIYIAGIIKNYSRILGLDSKKILAFFRRDYERQEEVKFKEKVSSSYLKSQSRRFFIGAIVFTFVLVFIYFGYQLILYFSPPKLTFLYPKTDNFTTEERVQIVAKTDKDAIVTIVGERIYLNKDGSFKYDFPLHEGKNKLTIDITGANGKTSQVDKIFIKNSPK